MGVSRGGLYQRSTPAAVVSETPVPSAFASLPLCLHRLQVLWGIAYLLSSALADSFATLTPWVPVSASRAIGNFPLQ